MELVHTEHVPTEHLSKLVQDEDELQAALAEGWVKEPYVPAVPPKPVDLYAKPKAKQEKK